MSEEMFDNLPAMSDADPPEEKVESVPAVVPEQTTENAIVRHLGSEVQEGVSEEQRASVQSYMSQMRFGIMGVTAITCKDEECPYYTKCPLVKAKIPRPKDQDCPVELDLQQQWLEGFVRASGIQLELLGAYDMLLLNDLAYQQVLEARAAMELSDNPQIQVKTYVGKDPKTGDPMYTYTLNNLVTFREKSGKMKMKILQEMIATAKAKSADRTVHMDRASETAERLKRTKALLKDQAIDADFTVKEEVKEDASE